MNPETVKWLLGTVIQGSIVVLAIGGALVTFFLSFVWQHFEKAKMFEGDIDRVMDQEMPRIRATIENCQKEIVELYESYFDFNHESLMGFYDMMISSYPLIARVNKFWRLVHLLYFLTSIFRHRFWKRARLLAAIIVFLAVIWPIRKWFKIHLERAQALDNTTLETAVRVRVRHERMKTHPKVGFSTGLLALGILRNSLRAISFKRGEVYSFDRIGLGFEIDLSIIKDDVEIKDWIKHEVANWAAGRELMDIIPSESTFLVELKSIDRGLFRLFCHNVKAKQQILNRAKAHYIAEDWQGKIQNTKKSYNLSLKEPVKRLNGQLAEPKENLSKLAFFVKSKGRTQLKTLIFLIMTFCGASIILGFITMAIASAKPSVAAILLYFSVTLLIGAVALLIILVALFLRSL